MSEVEGSGCFTGDCVRQPRAAAAPPLCAFAHADPPGGPSSLCPSALGVQLPGPVLRWLKLLLLPSAEPPGPPDPPSLSPR